ncbi:MAG: T9SS type A sorting domain-containing protein, partial [Bacteroidota bacterium]|nr:T9SS type A sorting domain-containing protein [Bacteroidota bacterium]
NNNSKDISYLNSWISPMGLLSNQFLWTNKKCIRISGTRLTGGYGGCGGSVFIVYENNGINMLLNSNIDVSSGNGGLGGRGGQQVDGHDGNNGSFDDLYSTDCYYLQYTTEQYDCQCDEIFLNYIENSINNNRTSWTNPSLNYYVFETTDGWTCKYNEPSSTPLCIDGKRLQCSKKVLINDGTNGKEAPIQELTTYRYCDMKFDSDLDNIWQEIYNEVFYNMATATSTTTELTIDGTIFNFKYSTKTLQRINNGNTDLEAISCCQPASGGGTGNENGLWGDYGNEGGNSNNGNSYFFQEEDKLFKKALNTGNNIVLPVFSLSPKPAKQFIDLNCKQVKGYKASIKLIDSKGKILQHKQMVFTTNQLKIHFNLNGFPSGIYFLQIDCIGENSLQKSLKFNIN